MDSSSSPVRGATLKTLATSIKRWPSLSPGFEPGLLKHLRQLPELCGASTLPGHLPAARLPGHRSGHGRAAEGGQEPGMFPSVGFLPRAGGWRWWEGFCTQFLCGEGLSIPSLTSVSTREISPPAKVPGRYCAFD